MSSRYARVRRPIGLALALLVVLASCALSAAGLFGPAEDGLTSWRSRLISREPTGQTAIVEIDAKSLAELESWPWPRRHHAELVRQLHASKVAIIAFDVDFSASSHSGDEELASAIREAGHVILPIFEQKSSGKLSEQGRIASRPHEAFESAWVGGVNIFPDPDGRVRSYPAATWINGTVQPSIATLLAERHGLEDQSFLPDWSIDADRIPRHSFVDVMKGRVPAGELEGKRILVGATAIELGDRYTVPRYGVLPGVVIQAIAAESLLQDRAVRAAGPALTFAGILLFALLLFPRPVVRPVRYGAAWLGLAAFVIAAPFAAQHFLALSLDSAAWLFTLVAAGAVQAGYEVRRRLRLRDELDADTGLPNRAMLELAIARSDAGSTILVAAAIERFDAIRDGIGLSATHETVRKVAETVALHVPGPVYRIAPDVLAWLMTEERGPGSQLDFKAMQLALREPVATGAGPVDVAFTLGLARGNADLAAVLLIEQALSAITTARAHGKSREWYRASDPQLRRQLSMMSELREAMENGRLSLAYQPKLSLSTGRIGDGEALIRWHDENGKVVPPDMFIPLAEATGFIPEITVFALRTAARDLARWAKEGVHVRIAVNVSAFDFGNPQFAETVLAILDEHGVPADRLALEVTESALIRSTADVAATLSVLRDAGIRLSVDDYGTGQSTLSYLKHLPVHELKIDKSFVVTLADSESDAIMVRSTVNLAHELGLEVVAEGIEDQATLDQLRAMGCDYAQGYFISKPIAADAFVALVASSEASRRVA